MSERLPTDVVEARLNHLIDRARRGALLPDEADRFMTELRDLVRRLEDAEDDSRRPLAQRPDMAEERFAWQERGNRAEQERDQYASAIRQLILQVKQTAHHWATTLPDTIRTADVTTALMGLCSPVPLPEGLRDDMWQRIVAAYYLRFENDGHPEDARAAADEAMAIVQPELDRLEAGQCIDRLGVHQKHHTKPVPGCPYKECLEAAKAAPLADEPNSRAA